MKVAFALRRWALQVIRLPERGVFLALVFVVVVASLLSSHFLTYANLAGILQDITFLGIISIGVATALLAGEIDISVGSVFSLASVVCARLITTWGIAPAVAVSLAVGCGCGFVNAVIARLLRIPAIIVTLATLGIYAAIALALAHGGDIDLSAAGFAPEGFFFGTLGTGGVGQISNITLVYFGVALVVALLLAWTTFGFRVYAVGSNPTAARLVGIRVDRTRMIVLTLSGLLASAAGVLSTAYLSGANPSSGTDYALDALAAAIIGGVALTGGSGSILGVFLGLLVVGVVRNMLVLTNISLNWDTAVSGAILLIAVGLNRAVGPREQGLRRWAALAWSARLSGRSHTEIGDTSGQSDSELASAAGPRELR